MEHDALVSAREALARLVDGNDRFISAHGASQAARWDRLKGAGPQKPFAIIVGCADSRVPVEIVFDQGFGDVFVVRVAGNIASPDVIGSVEYAAGVLGTPLVVVMGHTGCGAVTETVRLVAAGEEPDSPDVRYITDRIGVHVAEIVRRAREPESCIDDAVRANVRGAVEHLRHGSKLLASLAEAGRLAVVGAVYELDTGKVDFFDGVPIG